MRLAVVGANGKMGRELIAAIQHIDGVELSAAIVRAGSPLVGQDAHSLINSKPSGVIIYDDTLTAISKVVGVIDF